MSPKKSLREAYAEAIHNLPGDHPLRKIYNKKHELEWAMSQLTKIKDAHFMDRDWGTKPGEIGPNYQGPMKWKGGILGRGTKDRMPGTRPTPDGKLRHSKKGKDTYIPTPLDRKRGNGYI